MDIHKEISAKKSIAIHSRLKNVKIPKSDENELIIPCRVSYYGFILLNEQKEYVNDIATSRINETLFQVNKQIDLIQIEKKQDDSKDYQQNKIDALRWLLIAGLVISFIMYLLIIYNVTDFKEKYIFIPLSILIVIAVISLTIMFKGLTTHLVNVNIDQQIADSIDKVLASENMTYYFGKGYSWERQESFFWLSLKKRV